MIELFTIFMSFSLLRRIFISVFLLLLITWVFFRNPIEAFLYTHNLKFTWIVFVAQFTMDQFTFAHRIWNHPLNKPYKKEEKE